MINARISLLLHLVALAALPLCAGCGARPVVISRDKPNSPLVVLTGNDSQVSSRSFERIRSSAGWQALWVRHVGGVQNAHLRPAPAVDFNRCELIAIFGGESWNSLGFRVRDVSLRDEALVVRFDCISYQTISFATEQAHADRSVPFAIVCLHRSDEVVVLEENVQRYLGRPAKWEPVARLDRPEVERYNGG